MSKPLVIVESPTKAKTISNILGNKYKVASSVGHIRDLPKSSKDVPEELKNKVSWNGVLVEEGFRNVYVVPADKEKVITDLKKSMKTASEIYLASDEDREGESIAWHLLEELKPDIPIKRMVFHEITPKAIEKAIEDPREIDMNLVEAQEGRRTLDRMVGFELSKIMRVLGGNLSAGRVQSPAVKLIVEKEKERESFITAKYFEINISCESSGQKFNKKIKSINEKRLASSKDFNHYGDLENKNRININEEEAIELCRKLNNINSKITKIDEKKYRRSPSAPFRTSTLQRSASSRLGFSPSKTMGVAQRLYQEGLITYMRTDSTVLSETAISAARNYISNNFHKDYLPNEPRTYKSKVKNTQEAHEAIRPAGEVFIPPNKISSKYNGDSDEYKLYSLIFNQTISSQMTDTTGKTISIESKIAMKEKLSSNLDVDSLVISTSGTVIEFEGYRIVQNTSVSASQDLPKLKLGDTISINNSEYDKKETVPPNRYSESGLIEKLEDLGIGRPSTYASIISRITDVYVRNEGRTLIPEPIAFAKVSILQENFPDLVDYSFTAKMEEDLDEIANGNIEKSPWLNSFWKGNGTTGLKDLITDEKISKIDPSEATTIELCEDSSGNNIQLKTGRIVAGKARPYLLRSDGETAALGPNVTLDNLDKDLAEKLFEEKDALRKLERVIGEHPDGKPIHIRLGPFGPYLQVGEKEKGKKSPLQGPIFKSDNVEQLTLEQAMERLDLPRNLGKDEDGWEYLSAVGPYGPYITRQRKRQKYYKDELMEKKKDELIEISMGEEIKITKSGSKEKISDQIVENTLIQEKDLNSMSKEEVVGIARQFKVRIPFKKLENVAKPRLIEKILYQRENRSLDEEEDCLTINIDEAIEIFSQPYTRKKSN